MEFHLSIYFDPTLVFGGTPEAKALLDAIGPHAHALKASGRLVASYPLNLPQAASTVQVRDGAAAVLAGPFQSARETLGGFVVIEAQDMDEALEIAAEMPHARLGHIEVRPAIDFSSPRPQF
jgi:hypothetical protein